MNGAGPTSRWKCRTLRSAIAATRPDFAMPANACDSHMHAFGPLDLYPGIANPRYEYPGGDIDDYAALAVVLDIQRMVLVQPSFYGSDNRYLLEALQTMGPKARGVVMYRDSPMEPKELDRLHAAGVRGIRIDFFQMYDRAAAPADYLLALKKATTLADSRGWHVELYSPGIVIRDLTRQLAESRVPISVNHMGYMKNDGALGAVDFRNFVSAVRSGSVWVKLTAPYRVSSTSDWAYADQLAQTLIEAAPGRMLWGTDWPHIPDCDMDSGLLLNRFARWCPDEAMRNRILVDNPAHLYGYI